MKIEDTKIFGFEMALHGMRNPYDSWNKSDSFFYKYGKWIQLENFKIWDSVSKTVEMPVIGFFDMKLACKLIKGGGEHRKFMRDIHVQTNVTAPRYFWTEFDTYKIATVRNSCSTMHKLGHRDLNKKDFQDGTVMPSTLTELNQMAKHHRDKTGYFFYQDDKVYKGKELLRLMKKILPEGFLQKSTVDLNYETLLTMHKQRRKHKLKEWTVFCDWILTLPYMEDFVNVSRVQKKESKF